MYPRTSADIDRKTASRMLRVSVRTIDRYIRRGKLSAHESNGRIWLDKKEVMQYTPGFINKVEPPAVSIKSHKISDTDFYKDLYEETRRILIENQHKLEQTQYRIGQLESQLTHPVPPHTQERKEDVFSQMLFKKELNDQERQTETLKKLLKQEKISRSVFAVITYALLLLLPLAWYLLR